MQANSGAILGADHAGQLSHRRMHSNDSVVSTATLLRYRRVKAAAGSRLLIWLALRISPRSRRQLALTTAGPRFFPWLFEGLG